MTGNSARRPGLAPQPPLQRRGRERLDLAGAMAPVRGAVADQGRASSPSHTRVYPFKAAGANGSICLECRNASHSRPTGLFQIRSMAMAYIRTWPL
jgi:hypothetical protein